MLERVYQIEHGDYDRAGEASASIKRGDNKNYDITEKVLGERASHGCIRVQR
ncbi:MAG: hypothetical protein GX858_09055, partial [Clostridiales bacterium]|nr:hypothetical protein [Clostridiales bacterium]